jgi:hypothetical protein
VRHGGLTGVVTIDRAKEGRAMDGSKFSSWCTWGVALGVLAFTVAFLANGGDAVMLVLWLTMALAAVLTAACVWWAMANSREIESRRQQAIVRQEVERRRKAA